ncbi:MAG: flagellar basal body-associated FliL family protein [Candidatus Binatia bacterium]
MERLRRTVDPVVALVILLAFVAVGFWGYVATTGPYPVGKVERTRVKLSDGVVQFSANVELTGQIGQVEFNRHRLEIRDAFVNLLRSKSSYMIDNPVSREALQYQLMREVNRVASRRIARAITFPEFNVF